MTTFARLNIGQPYRVYRGTGQVWLKISETSARPLHNGLIHIEPLDGISPYAQVIPAAQVPSEFAAQTAKDAIADLVVVLAEGRQGRAELLAFLVKDIVDVLPDPDRHEVLSMLAMMAGDMRDAVVKEVS